MAEKKLYKETVVAGKEFKTQPPSQKMYRGISTVNEANSSFALYDIGLIKQDLLNHFHMNFSLEFSIYQIIDRLFL